MAIRFDRIDDLRIQKGVTEKELLLATQQSPNNFSRWRKGTTTPSYASILRIADYFGVDVRYLLGQVESPYGEINFETIKEDMEDCAMEVESIDEDNGAGQQWVVRYGRSGRYYSDPVFKSICAGLHKQIRDAELNIIETWRDKTFDIKPQTTNEKPDENSDLSDEEMDIIQKFRALDTDGKIMLKSALIAELRRMK